jgi:hypothetical protein
VDFDATGQLLITYSAFGKYLEKKWQYNEAVHQLFIEKKPMIQSGQEYNIIIEYGIPRKLVRLVKVCLNATCSRVQLGKHLSDIFPIKKGLKQSALFPSLFKLCCRVCH